MTAKKAPEQPTVLAVGALWEIAPGETVTVTRPDGDTVTVSGGVYVLSAPGEYVSGDQRVTAK